MKSAAVINYLSSLCSLAPLGHALLVPRQSTNRSFQFVPRTETTPPNHYAIGGFPGPADSRYYLNESHVEPPQEYQSRPFDIPFALLNNGTLNFFKNGQFSVVSYSDTDPYDVNKTDYANNSACGIPDNAYWPSKVAIHPYWLKYAPKELGLSRYCMQDVCISVWNETGANAGGTTDVELKVTDICSTDPEDPSYCESPADIMVDRRKAMLLYHATPKGDLENAALKNGKKYPHPVWWFFSKCLQDGLPQRDYNHTGNWFANPGLPNNTPWSLRSVQEQWRANVRYGAYKNADPPLPDYQMGAYCPDDERRKTLRFPIEQYWKKGDPNPEWCPVAGGKGHTKTPAPCPVVGSVAVS
ncbi:MAG: hypothetical protein Q9190_002587 [Brigantiaea leucoxantha]